MSDVLTGMVQTVIPSYLYTDYNDDDTLQAFVISQNGLAQEYVDWFNQINLPVYTAPTIVGNLLDWVGEGLYGFARPVFPLGPSSFVGPFNTYALNGAVAFNQSETFAPTNFYTATDDIYKRCLTWHFYKGDGQVFNTTWLKRRIMRFLLGANGVNFNVDQTYQVSVTFPSFGVVDIAILDSGNPFAVSALLAAAINCGALELPFQYTYNVTA